MWSWLKGLFSCKVFAPKAPELYEVGSAIITVETARYNYKVRLWGYAYDFMGNSCVVSAQTVFQRWQERCGETNMASIGNGQFVPMHLVTIPIKVVFEEHKVEI